MCPCGAKGKHAISITHARASLKVLGMTRRAIDQFVATLAADGGRAKNRLRIAAGHFAEGVPVRRADSDASRIPTLRRVGNYGSLGPVRSPARYTELCASTTPVTPAAFAADATPFTASLLTNRQVLEDSGEAWRTAGRRTPSAAWTTACSA